MTALKPIENLRVRGVPATRYPLNKRCAHPECRNTVDDAHHCFPRSEIIGDSWFVEIEDDIDPSGMDAGIPSDGQAARRLVIPHVSGLCRGHHEDVEQHRAWIRLEDGVWVWYDPHEDWAPDADFGVWEELGPLNPQPGSVEGKQKRRRHKGEKARPRVNYTIRPPKDAQEDGVQLLEEAVETLENKINPIEPRPAYQTIMDALNYTILNADGSDFSEQRIIES